MDFQAGGLAIKTLRKSKNLTQEQLADLTDLTSNTISRMERGLLFPSVSTLCDLCNALGTNADTILAAYIHADSEIRWSPLADKLKQLPQSKQDKIERILNCLIETI